MLKVSQDLYSPSKGRRRCICSAFTFIDINPVTVRTKVFVYMYMTIITLSALLFLFFLVSLAPLWPLSALFIPVIIIIIIITIVSSSSSILSSSSNYNSSIWKYILCWFRCYYHALKPDNWYFSRIPSHNWSRRFWYQWILVILLHTHMAPIGGEGIEGNRSTAGWI